MRFKGPSEPGNCMARFLEPCLLLLLSEESSYGYSLLTSLGQFGFSQSLDPGMVYRTLRRLEAQDMIVSRWDTQGSGPARRIYHVTVEGKEFLDDWASSLKGNVSRIEQFLRCYSLLERE